MQSPPDTTPFDSTIFDEFEGALVSKPTDPSFEKKGSQTTSSMARNMARLQPSRDPNEVRESYGLPRLEPDALGRWLEGAE